MQSRMLNELAAHGCNIEDMLENTFMGNEEFYEKMLRKLPESTALSRLHAAFDAGDVKGCFEAAHELKGLTATLGLAPLNRIVCEVVELVRPGISIAGVAERLPQMDVLSSEFLAIIAAN